MAQLEKALFYLDSIPNQVFEGYTDGDTWNGFECPYFEKSVAERVLEASKTNGFSWTYEPERDVYIVKNNQDPSEYEAEEFEGQTVTLNGQDLRLYAIGAYSWIWGIS